jgi:hypothetical protein
VRNLGICSRGHCLSVIGSYTLISGVSVNLVTVTIFEKTHVIIEETILKKVYRIVNENFRSEWLQICLDGM